MKEGELDYNRLIDRALRQVVRQALDSVIAHGLPDEHHFYIAFRTDAPGIGLPPFLRAQYPEEMTIVLQHQFWDLGTDSESMRVTLSFGGKPERLVIPFSAMTRFADPFAKFVLQFDPPAAPAGALAPSEAAPAPIPTAETSEARGETGASVVTLDAFRKKR